MGILVALHRTLRRAPLPARGPMLFRTSLKGKKKNGKRVLHARLRPPVKSGLGAMFAVMRANKKETTITRLLVAPRRGVSRTTDGLHVKKKKKTKILRRPNPPFWRAFFFLQAIDREGSDRASEALNQKATPKEFAATIVNELQQASSAKINRPTIVTSNGWSND